MDIPSPSQLSSFPNHLSGNIFKETANSLSSAQELATSELVETTSVSQFSRRSLLLIDPNVPNYQALVATVEPGTEIHVLSSTDNVLTQITNLLMGQQGIASLHIVSHAQAGALQLGQDWLTVDTLQAYQTQLQSWQNALTEDADILLYGCSIAEGEAGLAFVSLLSQLTGADIAASTDLTGKAALGGDWDLEVTTGAIAAALPFDPFTFQSILLAGNLDSSFGSGGTVITPIGSGDALGSSVTIDSSGNIIVAGNAKNGSNDDFTLARYTSSGVLDNSFGSGGIVTTPIGSGNDYGNSTTIDGNGNIVVVGFASNGSNNDFALARYTSSGVLDSSFGSGGIVTTPIGSGDDNAYNVAIDSNGNIVLAGYAFNGTTNNNDFALVRYTSTGVLDSSFGSGGVVTTPIGSGNDRAFNVAIDSSGNIVLVGLANNGTDNDFALVRYTSSGVLDSSFGSGGIVTTPIGSGSDRAFSVAIDSSGNLVVAGETYNGSNRDFALARYTSDGVLDNSFGSGGIVTTPIGSGNDSSYSIVIDSSGNIVVAGEANNGSNADFALARYTSSGVLDSSFGSGGTVLTPISSSFDHGYSIAIDSGGNLVVAGFADADNKYNFALARYLSNDAPTFINNATLAPVLEDATAPAGETIANLFTGQFSDVNAGSSLSGVAVVSNTTNATIHGKWQYSTGGTTWYDVGSVADNATALALSTSTKLRFLPAGNYNGTPPALTMRALDNTYDRFTTGAIPQFIDTSIKGGATAIAGTTNTLGTSITAVNDSPALIITIADQVAQSGQPFTATLPANTFTDVEGDNLTLSVMLADGGSLPNWLTFDASTLQLSGIPDFTSASSLTLKVTATDLQGATSNDEFVLKIEPLTGEMGVATPSILFNQKRSGVVNQGTKQADKIQGTSKNDILKGGDGNDIIRSGVSNSVSGQDKLYGNNGNDQLYGGREQDLLDGGKGNDQLKGGDNRDLLLGRDGRDRLFGQAGNDILVGGQGADILTGGSGKDMFVCNSLTESTDLITDFNGQDDLIDLRALFKASEFSANSHFAQYHQFIDLTQTGSNTEIQIDADGNGSSTAMVTLMTLKNLALTNINSTNFILG